MRKFLYSKTFIVICFLLCIVTSCSQKEEDIPEGIIEPTKMTEIIVDMHLIESTLLNIQQAGINVNNYRKNFYDLVFKKHKIKKADFDNSFNFYSKNNVKLMDKIYADVITNLSQKQSELKAQ